MAEQVTAPLLGGNDATEVGIRDGHGDEAGPPSDPAPSRPITGKAQFMYHKMMSGKAFNDNPSASEGIVLLASRNSQRARVVEFI